MYLPPQHPSRPQLTRQRLIGIVGAICIVAIGLLGNSATAQTFMRPAPVALKGYCPVCVIEMKQWVKGNPTIQARHDGKTYYFPSDEKRQLFLKNPDKYAPALGGNCAVCMTEMQKQEPGSIHFSALHEGRLFLFPSAEIKAKFMADPAKYETIDLALGGNCAVCLVNQKVVSGNPEFSTTYGGMRYQFDSANDRSVFLSNPTLYAR